MISRRHVCICIYTGWPRIGFRIGYECEKNKLIQRHISLSLSPYLYLSVSICTYICVFTTHHLRYYI